MKIKNKQKGNSFIGLMTIFSAFLTIVFVLITLLPYYMENFSVNSSITSTLEDPLLKKWTKKETKNTLLKRLSVSSVTNVTSKQIEVTKNNFNTKIIVRYDVQTRFFYNIDFLLHFETIEEMKY